MSYEKSLKAQWDEYATREGARRDGLREGLKEGLKEGKEIGLKEAEAEFRAKQEDSILKLLKLGLPDQQIVDILNVSDPFVQQVKEKHS